MAADRAGSFAVKVSSWQVGNGTQQAMKLTKQFSAPFTWRVKRSLEEELAWFLKAPGPANRHICLVPVPISTYRYLPQPPNIATCPGSRRSPPGLSIPSFLDTGCLSRPTFPDSGCQSRHGNLAAGV
jgi:hypothetical protein